MGTGLRGRLARRWMLLVMVVYPAATSAQVAQQIPSPSRSVAEEWLTKTERTGFVETARYDETVAYCRRLAAASPWIDVQSFGVSPEGRGLIFVVASKERAFTPEAAKAAGKPIVLVQNGIHAGECDGKDASLMLLRDMAVTKTRESLLDGVTLLVIPIFNVDGHERFGPYSRINQNGPLEMGWRTTAQNLNLNRDYMKADAPEMRAWLRLWNTWQPDFHFDNHVSDGGDWQYDVTFDADTHASCPPPLAGWIESKLYPHLFETLTKDGHTPAVYFDLVDWRDPRNGIRSGNFPPRFSTGYVALRNRPSLLVEMHALKPYRTRVIGNYNLMVRTLEVLNSESVSLKSAIAKAEARAIEAGRSLRDGVALSVRHTDKSEPFTFKGFAIQHELSDVSGAVRTTYDNTSPVAFDTAWMHETEPVVTVIPPHAYLIPSQWTEAIELLELHNVAIDKLDVAKEMSVELYRFKDVKFAERPFEGRIAPKFTVERFTEQRSFPAGTIIVRPDQPNGQVAIHLLEPDGPDSLVKWGFFNAIFEQKEYAEGYVLEKLARKMMADDPKLREEYLEKVRTDRAFASDARARLYYFFQRSPYWDERLNVYPVARWIGSENKVDGLRIDTSR